MPTLRVMMIFVMLLVMGCLEFWHKDVGIVPEAMERDSRE